MYRTLMIASAVLLAVESALHKAYYATQLALLNAANAAEDAAVNSAVNKADKVFDAAAERVHRAELEVKRAESAYEDEGKRYDAKLDALYKKHGYLPGV